MTSDFASAFPARFLTAFGMTNYRFVCFVIPRRITVMFVFVIPSIFCPPRNLIRFIIAFPARFLTAFGMTNKHELLHAFERLDHGDVFKLSI